MFQRDWLLRLVEQIAETVAKALGLAKEGRHDEAKRELNGAYSALGISRDLVGRLDASSIRMMAGDKLPALVKLLETEIEIVRLAGDEDMARRRERLLAALR